MDGPCDRCQKWFEVPETRHTKSGRLCRKCAEIDAAEYEDPGAEIDDDRHTILDQKSEIERFSYLLEKEEAKVKQLTALLDGGSESNPLFTDMKEEIRQLKTKASTLEKQNGYCLGEIERLRGIIDLPIHRLNQPPKGEKG